MFRDWFDPFFKGDLVFDVKIINLGLKVAREFILFIWIFTHSDKSLPNMFTVKLYLSVQWRSPGSKKQSRATHHGMLHHNTMVTTFKTSECVKTDSKLTNLYPMREKYNAIRDPTLERWWQMNVVSRAVTIRLRGTLWWGTPDYFWPLWILLMSI